MNKLIKYIKFSCGVKRFRYKHLSIQLHWPRWNLVNGDYYLIAPTVMRIFYNTPPLKKTVLISSEKNLREYGIGLILLGIGAALTWTKVKQ